MKYTTVFTKDWYGRLDEYEVLILKKSKNGMYSCTFINSKGGIEKVLVAEQDLRKRGDNE